MSTMNRLFSFLLFSFLTFTLQGQIGLGVKAGVNMAQQSIQDIDLDFDSDEISGSIWGAFLEVPLGEGAFALQPEFLVVQKGGKTLLPNIKTTINYIEIPILLKLRLINSNLIDINLLGGPSFGYARNGEFLEDNAVVKLNFGNDNIQRFDLGMHGGGAVELQLGSLRAFGDVRYLFGISDLDGTESRTVTNKGITVSAGLIFKLFD